MNRFLIPRIGIDPALAANKRFPSVRVRHNAHALCSPLHAVIILVSYPFLSLRGRQCPEVDVNQRFDAAHKSAPLRFVSLVLFAPFARGFGFVDDRKGKINESLVIAKTLVSDTVYICLLERTCDFISYMAS